MAVKALRVLSNRSSASALLWLRALITQGAKATSGGEPSNRAGSTANPIIDVFQRQAYLSGQLLANDVAKIREIDVARTLHSCQRLRW